MLQSYSDLDEEKRDMLKELGNIGTGNAITSLSQMIDQPLEMEIPKVCIVPFQKVPDMLGGSGNDTGWYFIRSIRGFKWYIYVSFE